MCYETWWADNLNQNTFWLKLSAQRFFFLWWLPLFGLSTEKPWADQQQSGATLTHGLTRRASAGGTGWPPRQPEQRSVVPQRQEGLHWVQPPVFAVGVGRTAGARRADWVTLARFARSAIAIVSSASPVRRQGKIGQQPVQPGRTAMAHRQSRSKDLQTEKGSGMSSTHRSRSPWKASTSIKVTSTSSSATGSRTTTSVPVVVAPKMDSEWVELADTRPELLMRFLIAVRVESLADVRGLWSSSSDFLQELEDFSGERMSADLTMQMATFWTTANAKALSYHKKLVRALVQDRQSSYRAPPTMHAEPPVLASSIPSRVKRLVATGLPGPPATTVALAAVDPYTQEEAKKKTKLDTLFQIALEDVLSLEQLGVTWETLEDAVVRGGSVRSLLHIADGKGMPLKLGLRSTNPCPFKLPSSWKRWARAALQQPHPSTKPCFGGRRAWGQSYLWNTGWLHHGGCTMPAIKGHKRPSFHRGSSWIFCGGQPICNPSTLGLLHDHGGSGLRAVWARAA